MTEQTPALRVAVDATPLLGNPTGVGVFCQHLLVELSTRSNVDVSAFAVSWRRRRLLADRVPKGVATTQRPMPARPLHAAWRRVRVPPIEYFVGRCDVVHGTNFTAPPTRQAATVITVHDLTFIHFPELSNPRAPDFAALIRVALARGAWVHTPSRFVADEVIEAFNVPAERVRPIAHGTPGPPIVLAQDEAEALCERVLGPGRERFVLALGTIEPRKDLVSLVHAFESLAPTHTDVSLVLAGPPGWGSEQVDRVIAQSALGHRIIQIGWIGGATKAALLQRASVLAYPSRYEGFGLPPLEAMTYETPVVATTAGALPEVIGDAAELVAVGDVAALAAALGRVLDDEAFAAELVRRGSARAEHYSWIKCAQQMTVLYGDAARGRDD